MSISSFGKAQFMLTSKQGLLPIPTCLGAGVDLLETRSGGQKAWKRLLDLDLLQAFEISQNHQDILWKSLEKTSGFLEMLGKSLEVDRLNGGWLAVRWFRVGSVEP